MDVAEWIIVAILSATLFVFLVVGIVLIVKLFGVVDEAKRVVIRSQDIADNANDLVANVKGFTSVGGAVQTFVDNYVEPRIKEKSKEKMRERKQERKGEKK